ncbi:MAG: DNA gyrase C-terminal beta-propeller domain-containing protein, partial [Saprospiraceae bacterium]
YSIFVVSEKGNGKRSPIEDYRITNRGGKGVKTINVTEKTGKLVAIKWVSEFDDMMITTEEGIIIRTPVSDIRLMGRATQGVKVIRIQDNESIADVTVIRREEVIDEEE